ncbi:MAG: hypothetical protein J3R72DRAFT_49818 [Linnemannia gamsii]|nr:MAG: hypothetical protein J3R72DRAFT_49818 [Linnemannia gamsii]
MGDREPGYFIKRFLCDVAPEGLSSRKKGQVGYRGAVELMSIEQIKNHLRNIQSSDFEASTYDTKGYLLRGSILTNGVTMQLAAFKLKELQSVRYKRLPEDKLPPRLTSTVGGTDHYLTEIRNVIGSKEDVTFYWPNCPPEDIKILCLDLGQAYTAAASAILPDFASSNSLSKGKTPVKTATSTMITTAATSTTTTCNLSAITPMSASSTLPPQGTHVFHNLAVSQKAIMQPTFKHRHWIEEQKRLVPPGASKSVEQIESQLPALCGEGASVVAYLAEVDKFQDQLDNFYNGNNDIYMKHEWDAKRARDQEFKVVANRLLGVVGGSIGCKRKDDNMVVIGIGLGDFSSKTRLTSLHGSFISYFVGTSTGIYRGGPQRVLYEQEVPGMPTLCLSSKPQKTILPELWCLHASRHNGCGQYVQHRSRPSARAAAPTVFAARRRQRTLSVGGRVRLRIGGQYRLCHQGCHQVRRRYSSRLQQEAQASGGGCPRKKKQARGTSASLV